MARKGWWVGAALLVLAGVGWLYYDEPLETEAQDWLDAVQARSQGSSAAYELLLGLDAPLEQDAREAGRRRLAQYATKAPAPLFSDIPPDDRPVLESAGFDVLCALAQAGCFERFVSDPDQAQRLLDEHGVLLQRYRDVLEQKDFRSLARLDLDEPLPAYGLMLKGNRLLGLQALRLAQAGDGRGARLLLEDDLRQVRVQLAESDQLVGKMTWVNLLAADLDLLVRMRAHGLLDRMREQPQLSERERDILPSLQREFAGQALYYQRLAASSQAREEFAPGMLSTLYKPRQSVNLLFDQHRRAAEAAALDAAAFAAEMRRPPQPRLQPWRRPTNAVGVILTGLGPSWEVYGARLHDLDAKLRLFNLLARLPVGEMPTADWMTAQPDAENPYEPGSLPKLSKQSMQLCYDGPLEDSLGLRCVSVRGPLPVENSQPTGDGAP